MKIVLLTAALGLTLLCGCTQPAAAPADPAASRELKAMSYLKATYKDVVTGTDVKGSTLLVYVDVNNLQSMDEQAEDQLEATALQRWKTAWSAAHPHEHGTVRLSLRDYYGTEVYHSSAKV